MFSQVGGLVDYSGLLKEKHKNKFAYCTQILSYSHELPLRSHSVDCALIVKALYRFSEGLLYSWKNLKSSLIEIFKNMGISNLREKEYQLLSIIAYSILTINEANRVAKEIVVIPDEKLIEEHLIKLLRVYAKATNNKISIDEVKYPTWSLEKNGKIYEEKHWLDNTTHSIIFLKSENYKPMNKDMLVGIFQILYSYEDSRFKEILKLLSRRGINYCISSY
jgi:hypothetical protein